MFLKVTASQVKFMLRQKNARIVFYILLVMILTNFISNVLMFQGMDVINMYHPMKLLLLSWNRSIIGADLLFGFLQLYPLLVICPAGFSMVKEQQTGQHIILAARMGNKLYYFSKMTAAYIVTFLVFSLPFMIEIGLNCLAFPLNAQGDLSNWSYYDPSYKASVENYLFSKIFLCSPYISAMLGTILLGLFSGLLAAFTVAVSSVFRFRYRVFLFLPVFLLLNVTEIVSTILFNKGITFRLSWYNYFTLFNDEPKNIIYFLLSISILVALTFLGISIGGRKDCIQ